MNFSLFFLPDTSKVPPPKSKTRTICLDLNRVREEGMKKVSKTISKEERKKGMKERRNEEGGGVRSEGRKEEG